MKLIGETTPVESIIQYHSEEPESHEIRGLNQEIDSGVIELAKLHFTGLVNSGMTEEVAIKNIFNLEPFNQYPELIQFLK